MAVRSLKNSTIENFANYNSSMNAGYSFQDYELIESVFLASSAASVTFSNLNQYATEYKHLQIRALGRVTGNLGNDGDAIRIRFNSDTGNNYSNHSLYAVNNGVTSTGGASQNGVYVNRFTDAGSTANAFGSFILDFLDSYSTSKNKTIRSLGSDGRYLFLSSAAWYNTASVTSIEVAVNVGTSYATGSRFSLYGIR